MVIFMSEKKINKTRVVLITWIIIGVLSLIIALPIYLHYKNEITLIIFLFSTMLAYEFVMRIALGGLLVLPNHNPDKGIYVVKEWELKYFDKHNYKKRVNNLPTFNPKQYDPKINTIEQIIQNTCKNEFTHRVYFFLTYLPIIWFFLVCWWYSFIALGIAIIVSIHDIILVSFQRFSRHRLIRLRDRKNRTEAK